MKKWLKITLGLLLIFVLLGGGFAIDYFGLIPEKSYSSSHFGIQTLKSAVDFNGNGIDDYSDFVAGARLDAQNRPKYDGSYFSGGYPPEEIGVCTDVVWRAFRRAGYNLKEMVDADIAARPEAYPHITDADPNIDFRRVTNLRIFFEEYGISLSVDKGEIADWQPGDIVVFGNDKHIGIVSDKRNKEGQPYILHNGGQYQREENYLPDAKVTARFRFDASVLSKEGLISWESAEI